MMKRLTSLLLAMLLTAGMTTGALAATSTAVYPVGDVSSKGYLTDEDGYVDMTNPVGRVPYGSTIYFPLLNDKSNAAAGAAQKDYDEAVKAYIAAETEYNTAKTAYDSKEAARKSAQDADDAAQQALNAGSSTAALEKAKTDAERELTEAKNLVTTRNDALNAAKKKEAEYEKLKQAVTEAEQNLANADPNGYAAKLEAKNKAQSALDTNTTTMQKSLTDVAAAITDALQADYADLKAAVNAAQAALNGNPSADLTALSKALGEAQTKLLGTPDTTDDALETAVKNVPLDGYQKLQKNLKDAVAELAAAGPAPNLDELKNALTAAIALRDSNKPVEGAVADAAKKLQEAENAVPTKQKAFDDADAALKKGVDTTELKEEKRKTAEKLAAAQQAEQSAKTILEQKSAVKAVAETRKINADAALKAAQGTSAYAYVYESSAAGSGVRISKSWEANGTYVSNLAVVKKKVTDASKITGASTTAMRYLYFVAITIKNNTSTATKDLLGTVTLKKSGTNSFSDIKLNVGVEMGYSAISSKLDGVIPIKPAALSQGEGFDAESDFVFSFEGDDASVFTVNTNGQGRIVLGMNTNYDNDIGDRYSSADLEFWNGNYASFNKSGVLTLCCDEAYKYIYSIDKNDKLTQLSVKRDSYEGAFLITTRTLGRYVVSNVRLKNTGSTGTGSGSSSTRPSSSAGNGGVTVTPVTPTTPTPTTPAPKPSTPAVPKPSSSAAPKPSSSAAPSSSEAESLPEESSSLPEQSISEPDEIVDVGGETPEPPETEKRGVPTVVWALLVALIVAIPVTFGVSYYLKNQNGRKRH